MCKTCVKVRVAKNTKKELLFEISTWARSIKTRLILMTIIKIRRVFFCLILSVRFGDRFSHPFVPRFWVV